MLLGVLADELNVSVQDLKGPRRTVTLTNSRAVCHWALKQLGLSHHEIGSLTNKDHSAVVRSVKKVNAKREVSEDWVRVSDSALLKLKSVVNAAAKPQTTFRSKHILGVDDAR